MGNNYTLVLQRDPEPAPDAEHNDQQGLDGMDDEGKGGSIGSTDAVEHQHGDDGKMPRTCAIGGRHYHGKGASYKHYQACQKT